MLTAIVLTAKLNNNETKRNIYCENTQAEKRQQSHYRYRQPTCHVCLSYITKIAVFLILNKIYYFSNFTRLMLFVVRTRRFTDNVRPCSGIIIRSWVALRPVTRCSLVKPSKENVCNASVKTPMHDCISPRFNSTRDHMYNKRVGRNDVNMIVFIV